MLVGKPKHETPSRWKVPNEILFLRVREIDDLVFENVREPWFDRKCLFRVSNAHPVGRASAREDVFRWISHPDRELEGGERRPYT